MSNFLKAIFAWLPFIARKSEEYAAKKECEAKRKAEIKRMQQQDEREQIARLQKRAGEAGAAQSRNGDGTI